MLGYRNVGCVLLAMIVTTTGALPMPTGAQPPTLTANDCSALVVFGTDYRPTLGEIACGTLTVSENWDLPAS